ncbi:MAG: hypothetical protein JF599_02900 [Verrucomicrobia bacterium]|nr:hypothetical protein [Verrucomicrobiota bacterium]
MNPINNAARPQRLLGMAMVVLVLFKLWLVGAQTIQAIGPAGHDDRLFLQMTGSMLRGEWLGHYSQMTLAKGPFFSMFTALSFVLSVPLFIAQHLLYALACWVVIRALRPWSPVFFLQLGLFTALLFNPVTYDSGIHTRVLRQNLTPALSLMILAGLLALHGRREWSPRKLIPWALLLGGALSALSLTREDSIWIAPALLLPWAATAWQIWRKKHEQSRLRKLGVVIMIPLAVYGAGLSTVGLLNWHYYGVFTTCEFKSAAFKDAYGSLTRVTPAHWQPYIPVARETRERIYAISPAFAELRADLEGQLGFNWAANSQALLGLPPEDHEIAGGWFPWALRDAVAYAGHARTGAEAMAFYARIAQEVNAACDQGLIEAGPARSGFIPPWNKDYTPHLIRSAGNTAKMLFTFEHMAVTPKPSIGPPVRLLIFADLTRGRLSSLEGEKSPLIGQAVLDHVRLSILKPIGRIYAATMPWLGIGALLCTAVGLIRVLSRRRIPYWGLFSAGLLGSCFALILICALVDTTSFPAISQGYLTGGYGFFIFFVFTGVWTAYQQLGLSSVES